MISRIKSLSVKNPCIYGLVSTRIEQIEHGFHRQSIKSVSNSFNPCDIGGTMHRLFTESKIISKDPISGLMVDLFNPRIDDWAEHFVWSDNFSMVEGITPIGRGTLALLQLNRKGVVNLRKALFVYGVHPRLRD
jgi:hypothetical protein